MLIRRRLGVMTVAENLILTGPDGTEYTFPGVSKVSIRKSGGGRAEYGSGGGGDFGQLVDRTITAIAATDLEDVTEIGSFAFAGCRRLASIEIPASVTLVGYGAFIDCSSLRSVTIPDTVEYLGMDSYFFKFGRLFENCSDLQTFSMGELTYAFLEYAFADCTYLTSVVLSARCGRMNGAFSGCSRLMSITIKNTTPPAQVDSSTFSGVPSNCLIYVPADSVQAYKTANIWMNRGTYIRARPT